MAEYTRTTSARASVEARLRARVEKVGECLVWSGATLPSGYGVLSVRGKTRTTHSAAWELANGPAPEGFVVDHVCHNRGCVNLEHLRLATMQQNAANRVWKTRSKTGIRGVYLMPQGTYTARVTTRGVRYEFGPYSTAEEAETAVSNKREELFGDFSGTRKGLA